MKKPVPRNPPKVRDVEDKGLDMIFTVAEKIYTQTLGLSMRQFDIVCPDCSKSLLTRKGANKILYLTCAEYSRYCGRSSGICKDIE